MHIIRDFSDCPPAYKGAVIALGNFDGVHMGHQAILRDCVALARASNVPAAVMTFEPHPREFFAKDKPKLRIYPFRRKVELLREAGIDALFLVRFNRDFAALSGLDFVQTVLHQKLAVRHVVTGYNFAFGRGREGNTHLLEQIAEREGFGFTACPALHDAQGHVVSSSAIREALAAGHIRQAAAWLGRPYGMAGRVVHGDKRGRELGFPTANIPLTSLFKPRFGIYAVRVKVENTWHDAVASLGVKPTFGLHAPMLEVHLFNMQRDLYGKRLQVEYVDFMRDEERFSSVEALRAQMEADSLQAKELLKEHHAAHA